MKKTLLITVVTVLSLVWKTPSFAQAPIPSGGPLSFPPVYAATQAQCLATAPTGITKAACALLVEGVRKATDQLPPVHEPIWGLMVFDVGGAVSRTVDAAIKYFLGDDKKITAKLVYDDGEGGGGGGGGGGCGGVYKPGSGCNMDLVLSAVTSPLTDIFAEVTAYPENVKVQGTNIWELAKYRTYDIVQDRASLDQLSAEQWSIRYKAQQRAIRAMTDALVMKKAYSELARIGERVSEGNFSNYGEAASTIATRRLLLDALFALRKRVIAARVRARAETMEVKLEAVPTEPTIESPRNTTQSEENENNNNSDNNPQTQEASGDQTGSENGSGDNAGGNS